MPSHRARWAIAGNGWGCRRGPRQRNNLWLTGCPRVLPPDLPKSDEAFICDYEVIWSIYIRCNNRQQLRAVHIPAFEALIGQPHGGECWLTKMKITMRTASEASRGS